PATVLRALLEGGAEGAVMVWAEAAALPEGVVGHRRHELAPAPCLAVWTLPPGPEELAAALEAVAPEVVCLFDTDPGLDEAEPFLAQLAGMVRHVLGARDGWIALPAAAAYLGHRVAAVEAGLAWLAAGGQIRIAERAEGRWRLARGGGARDAAAVAVARRRLEALLAETAAYRAYLRQAPTESLAARH
ncbi:MAG: hypothetical protein PVG11_05075, partial [Anaerolineae bacterium]